MVYIARLLLVRWREERVPRIASESMVEVAIVADERRNIKVVVIFW